MRSPGGFILTHTLLFVAQDGRHVPSRRAANKQLPPFVLRCQAFERTPSLSMCDMMGKQAEDQRRHFAIVYFSVSHSWQTTSIVGFTLLFSTDDMEQLSSARWHDA